MFIQSFAVRLKRIVHVACDRSFVAGLSPLDCMLVAAMAAAVALAALLCSAASRLGFAQVWRVGGWLP
ncbi:hypothetical protein [Burkholderia pyrrocinia]|uniref:hypothetical protein n=1 Tax=Burkholderia pyrrocinia TaxID=60550 RepID=UPI001052D5DD|nr:hypothetical protein [Burkholderia pyrrocinia]TDA48585.1 hypothetical protein EVG18_04710 [Burkholderia pyrrocinia]